MLDQPAFQQQSHTESQHAHTFFPWSSKRKRLSSVSPKTTVRLEEVLLPAAAAEAEAAVAVSEAFVGYRGYVGQWACVHRQFVSCMANSKAHASADTNVHVKRTGGGEGAREGELVLLAERLDLAVALPHHAGLLQGGFDCLVG